MFTNRKIMDVREGDMQAIRNVVYDELSNKDIVEFES